MQLCHVLGIFKHKGSTPLQLTSLSIIKMMEDGKLLSFDDFRSLFYFPSLHKPEPIPQIKVSLVKQLSNIQVLNPTYKEVSAKPKKAPPKRYISRQKLLELSKPRLSAANEAFIGHS
jgi:hypothetical protein